MRPTTLASGRSHGESLRLDPDATSGASRGGMTAMATDPDGHVVVLTAPRLAEIAAEPEWTATVTGSLGRRPGGS